MAASNMSTGFSREQGEILTHITKLSSVPAQLAVGITHSGVHIL